MIRMRVRKDRGLSTEEAAGGLVCAEAAKPLPRFSVRILALQLALASLLAGCHRYEPVTAASVATGASVAVSLTDYGTANLGRLLGLGVGTVEGNLVTVSDSAYTLAVQLVRQRNGIETLWRGEQVAIPRVDVAEIRQRRISRSKSAVAAVALLAAAYGAVEAFIGTGSGSPPPGGSGGGGPR
jgi:hypothetical protein